MLVLPEWESSEPDSERILRAEDPLPLRIRARVKNVPVILKRDGTLWREASLYLLSRMIDEGKDPQTVRSNATHLLDFLRWCEATGCAWSEFPKAQHERPTYLYLRDLRDRTRRGEVSVSTASIRMRVVVSLYRWLVEHGIFVPAFPPFIERLIKINVKDSKGFTSSVIRRSTNLAIPVPKREMGVSVDGGLRPLDSDEQALIMDAAREVASPETRLMMALALHAGFRIETVCDFKVSVLDKLSNMGARVAVRVGPAVGIKTKGNVNYVAQCRPEILQQLRVYSQSERRQRRALHASGTDVDLLFLTRDGNPFMRSEAGRAPTGVYNDIARVRNCIRRSVPNFSFRFHDLRASYGLNLLADLTSFQRKHRVFESELDLLMIVRDCLGHSSLRTTWSYLNYQKRYAALQSVNSEHEDWVMSMVKGV